MRPFNQSPSEEESVNYKNCSHHVFTLTSTYDITMEDIEQMSQKMLQEKSKIK